MSRSRPLSMLLAGAIGLAVLVGCTDDPEPVTSGAEVGGEAPCRPDGLPPALEPEEVADAPVDGATITLATHDSFATSEGVFDAFTEQTGVTVEVLRVGDAGTLVSQSILTAGEPVADVLFGIDTTFLCRGTRAGIFTPYAPEALADVDDALELDPDHLVTPIDVGDVCLNYSRSAFPDPADAPSGLDDLTDERFADQFVTPNPESSSPGLAFLLATIAEYGPDGWQDYWERCGPTASRSPAAGRRPTTRRSAPAPATARWSPATPRARWPTCSTRTRPAPNRRSAWSPTPASARSSSPASCAGRPTRRPPPCWSTSCCRRRSRRTSRSTCSWNR